MIEESTTRMRLCPNCANSIGADAAKCPYCKANVSSHFAPQWLKRDAESSEPQAGSDNHKRFPIPAKLIWPATLVVTALIAFFAGGYVQGSRLSRLSEANLKQLQAKDQMIQSQEAQLAQTRQQLNESSNKLAEMETKLEESRKEVSLAQQRLKTAARPVDAVSASRSANGGRTAARAPDTAAAPPPQPAARRTAGPGAYETTRATAVYESPSSSARVISKIGPGTRINVVNSTGDWLEVRSNRGNPPGYVRSDDARVIPRASREAPREERTARASGSLVVSNPK